MTTNCSDALNEKGAQKPIQHAEHADDRLPCVLANCTEDRHSHRGTSDYMPGNCF